MQRRGAAFDGPGGGKERGKGGQGSVCRWEGSKGEARERGERRWEDEEGAWESGGKGLEGGRHLTLGEEGEGGREEE